MPIQRVQGGFWLKTSGGAVANECCCGDEGPPQPSTCPNEDPEILCSIFDSDYAGGGITWCGETWSTAEVQAGAQKTVCPDTYILGGFDNGSNSYFQNEVWIEDGDLIMSRQAEYFPEYYYYPYGYLYENGVKAFLQLAGPVTTFPADLINGVAKGAGPPTWPNYFSSSLNLLTGGNKPSRYNYRLIDDFFGSHTVGGVKYSWARGNGW